MHWGTVNESDSTAAVAIDSSKAAGRSEEVGGESERQRKEGREGRTEGQRQKSGGKKLMDQGRSRNALLVASRQKQNVTEILHIQ